MKAFDRIREGLEQAIAHAAGEPVEAVIHRPYVPDVKSIRQKTGMTQEQFASRCHISVNTLRDICSRINNHRTRNLES